MKELTPEEVSAIMNRKPAGEPGTDVARDRPTGETPVEPIAAIPAPVARGVVEEFKRLKRGQVTGRADNPRAKINVEKASFREMVESVRELGVVTPLIVRPHPAVWGQYELLAGHRRLRAAEVAGVEELPAVVKHLNDREALEVMCLENFDREDLTPLEEARSYRLMLDDDHRIEQLSVRIGKTRGHIARRVQLLKLNAKWLAFAEEYEIPAAHLELVARMDEAAQRRMWEHFDLDPQKNEWGEQDRLSRIAEHFFGPGSFAEFRKHVADEMCDLSLAPWGLEDTVLVPKAGACAVCPKRSGCQPDLFSEEEFTAGNRCLDTECWGKKMEAFKKRREAELRKEYPNMVRVLGEDSGLMYDERKALNALESYDYKKVTAKTKDAVPAFVVAGEGEGTLIWIARHNTGGSGSGSSGSSGKRKETAAGKQAQASLDPEASAALLKEKQEAHEQRRWAWVCKRLQEMLEENDLPVNELMRTAEGLVGLVAEFGTAPVDHVESGEGDCWSRLMGMGPAGSIEWRQEVWKMICPKLKEWLMVFTVSSLGASHHAAIQGCCWLLGISVEEMKADADREIPEPKSWEQLRKLAEAPAAAAKKSARAKKEPKGKPDAAGKKKKG